LSGSQATHFAGFCVSDTDRETARFAPTMD
jgi:hypothetical protein